jgi:hypothetical protein
MPKGPSSAQVTFHKLLFTSYFLRTQKQWGRILEAAIVAAQPSHKNSKVSSNVIDLEDVEVDAGDADTILIDNDSD